MQDTKREIARRERKPGSSLPERTTGPLRARPAAAPGAWPGAERRNLRARRALIERVRQEFDEMPGLQLTVRQAARLLSLDTDVCGRVLGELARVDVLQARESGMFRRRGILPWPRHRASGG